MFVLLCSIVYLVFHDRFVFPTPRACSHEGTAEVFLTLALCVAGVQVLRTRVASQALRGTIEPAPRGGVRERRGLRGSRASGGEHEVRWRDSEGQRA